jgi:tetratricopeptide (TPR) repeat protein
MTPIHPLLLVTLLLMGSNTMALDISSLWDHSKPELSEQRFRDALKTASENDALILQTQIARTYGVRKDFVRAREVLGAISGPVKSGSPEAQVRYFLELGRTYASAAHPPDAQTPENKKMARTLYTQAFEAAQRARLDYLAIDALHMMAFVDTETKSQLDWDLKALAYMEGSSQPEAKKWEGSLRNNVGYAKHLLGQYDEALVQFRLSLAAHERAGSVRSARIAHWMIAWTLRAQGRFQEAIDIQLRLEREWAQAGEPDPYVFEELEHLYRATNDSARADAYATKLRDSRKEVDKP